MLPYLLLVAGLLITAVLLVAFFMRFAAQGVKLEDADNTITALNEHLQALQAEHERLTQRIQNLEAIVTTEAWDALPEQQRQALMDLPEPAEPSPEEKAARLARQRSA